MMERPGRFVARVAIGLLAVCIAGSQWVDGNTIQALRGFMLVASYVIYVAVLMKVEATE